MPVRYVCKNCGQVLWIFTKVGQDYLGVPSPDELRRIYGVCPKCKKDIAAPRFEDVIIKPAIGLENLEIPHYLGLKSTATSLVKAAVSQEA